MTTFILLTVLFIAVSVAMILIILVQRSQGGGLAGAFGGAGGTGTDTVFGGRVGDALTWATIIAFVLYLLFAILLNRVPTAVGPASELDQAAAVEPDATGAGDPGAGAGTAPVAGEAGSSGASNPPDSP